jgi:hypothetical protein
MILLAREPVTGIKNQSTEEKEKKINVLVYIIIIIISCKLCLFLIFVVLKSCCLFASWLEQHER